MIFSAFHSFDLFWEHLINQVWINPVADKIMALVSDFDLFKFPLILLALLLLIWGRFQERLFIILFLLCLLIGDTGIVNGLKHMINRPRPLQAIAAVRVVSLDQVRLATIDPQPGGHSFPSGHTCNNVALALVAFTLYGGWTNLFWLWAILMGYSRIYVGAHYPTDVLASWFIALAYTWLILRATESLWRRYAPKYFPELYRFRPKLLVRQPIIKSDSAIASSLPSQNSSQTIFKTAITLICFLTLFRFWYCTQHDIIADEAYYFLWSKHLDASYYSKGPAIAWTIAFGTWIFGDNAFGIRWLSVLLSAGTGWQLFLLARRLVDEKTGLISICIAAIIPIFAVGSVLMTIDPLSVFFWVWAANLFLDALQKNRSLDWILVGFAVGSGFLAKFVNALELLSFLLFLIWSPQQRKHLKNPKTLLTLLIFAICTLPVFYWNAKHGWITATHLRERGAINHSFHFSLFELWGFFREQALVISPLLFIGVLIAPISTALNRQKTDAERYLLSLFITVFLFYVVLAFNKTGEANWTVTAYISGIILLVIYWRKLIERNAHWKWLTSIGLIVALLETVALHETAPLHLPQGMDPLDRARGWKNFGQHIDTLRQQYRPQLLIGEKYQTASLLSYYLPDRPTTYIPHSQQIENQFSFWPSYQLNSNEIAFFVTEKNNQIPEKLRFEFCEIRQIDDFFTEQDGRKLQEYRVYLLTKPTSI